MPLFCYSFAMSSSRLSSTEHDVLRTIITHEGISRNQLAQLLHVSMPTIAASLKHLQELRYIAQTRGMLESTGGRRSDGYSFAYSRCICIGVLVRGGTVRLVATNLRGDISSKQAHDLTRFGTSDFYDGLALAIESFIESSHIDTHHLRGIGVTVASRAALDESSENRLRATIESRLSYPIRIMREPLALAAAETLFQSHISDAACLYLNSTMSSAFIRGGRYLKNSSFIEHMTLYPRIPGIDSSDVRQCECGQWGCAHMYCSSQALLNSPGIHDTNMREFIDHMRDGSYTHAGAFSTYADSLALLIHNIRMIINVPVILGGEVGRYLDSSDITDIRSRVRALTPHMLTPSMMALDTPSMSPSSSQNPVLKSICSPDQAIIGAAYVLAQDYLDSLLS